ncbi:DUF2497 domain-containing protein [Brevundimonas sp.]|uniref:DUF2497 domain-containing protein n=1 Tax=Brevundimonas sp. TaxID=1871086 RepID=UPI002AB9A577|nr:DUF2497 domain-containing protein [Brevundimonas sp.]MDZ4362234.1 DUF2497 domain-containing protein [Brevundimonas sp.]
MTDQTAQEPTMEEILASIRRIISEDDAPAETALAPAPTLSVVEPEPEPAYQATAAVEEDVLELTDRYEAPPSETIGDLDVTTPYTPEPEPEPFPAAFSSPEPVVDTYRAEPDTADSLVGDTASASAASAFAGLTAALKRPEPEVSGGGTGPTIDELARALLRPMLKDWLDANLPGIVEAAVKKEVERISRTAG